MPGPILESVRTSLSRTVRVGLVLFLAGLVFISIDVLPFAAGAHDRPLWLNLACLAAPLGLGVLLVSTVRSGRAEQRAAAREVSGR